ncbi:MAG: hypothetical protein GY852_09585 [bacterium]|nr:hypothetical protein [bacterium]
MKYGLAFALLVLVGLSFAIQPAETWQAGPQGKYTQVGNANVLTEGGNVTPLNLSSNVSTEKWAGYYGNVTGQIVLAPNTADMFYTWAWTSANGGEVCAIAAPAGFNWAGLVAAAAGDVDTVWGFDTTDTDSSTNTMAGTCNVDIAGITVSTACTTMPTSGLESVVVNDGATAAKSDIAFCVNITSGTALFDGSTGDYELMTAANETAGATDTHYFWLELN